jgi:ABC-2 type transport system permease protein
MTGANDDSSDSKLEKLAGGIGIRESMLHSSANRQRILIVYSITFRPGRSLECSSSSCRCPGHIIREREQGSALRVRLIPGAERGVGIGRILFNTIVCCVQFVVMCAVGRWLLPVFGLPALTLGQHPGALIPVVLATAICATAFGYCLGMMFRSGAQALPFGSIAIVILSALGGIWVPVELLPPVLQATAKVSPLHWALDGHAIGYPSRGYLERCSLACRSTDGAGNMPMGPGNDMGSLCTSIFIRSAHKKCSHH